MKITQYPTDSDEKQQLAQAVKPTHPTVPTRLVNPVRRASFSDLPFRNIEWQPLAPRTPDEPSAPAGTHPRIAHRDTEPSYSAGPSSQQAVPYTPVEYLQTPEQTPSPLNPDTSIRSATQRSASLSANISTTTTQPPTPSKARRASVTGAYDRLSKEGKIGRRKKKKAWKERLELDWDSLAAEQQALFSAHGTLTGSSNQTPIEEAKSIKQEKVDD
ncbi:MAG: hypothetical protein L6R40_007793 [Gallowayella cf. fulva]|nr:MAG: hypothetical protein L6R40_007793 [Xanthomendoza cf. fulva]